MENHHAHCMNCISRRCMTRPEAGVSCDLASCALVCGAVFHGCKADEHRLLCPLERVPCLNSGFGCPFTVTRGKMSEHLAVCPASVVCCTMEWNRWPISDADRTSYENLSRDVDEVEQLDMALALQDQRMLLESLKVATMLSKNGDNPPGGEKTGGPAAPAPPPGCRNEKIASGINGLDEESYSELYQATVETSRTLVAALDILSSATKEMDTLNGGVPADGRGEPNGGFHGGAEAEVPGSGNVDMKGSDSESDCELGAVGGMDLEAAGGAEEEEEEDAPDGGKTWTKRNGFLEPENGAEEEEDGVFGLLERDEKPLCNGFHSPGDEPDGPDQMDLEVAGERRPEANGSWEVFRPANGAEALLNRSVAVAEQRPSCSQPPPRLPLPLPIPLHDIVPNGGAYPLDLEDRWLERKLQNLQALRAMGSFAFSGRRALYADSLRVKMEDKSVDTSDLEVADDPMGLHGIDLITAALLFCLGDSPGGRGISDSRFVDGYRIDLGTQTFSFPSAILATNTMVGDVASASACDHASPQLSNPSPFHTLRLDLVLQCVARYQTKQRSMFTFVCGQLFRRDEFSSHFKNVHCDIHAGLNGWMEHRCPLAYYGCTYSQRRFCPSTQGYRIIHDRHLRSFGVRPRGSAPPPPPSPSPSPGGPPLPGNACRFGTDCDHLSGLPFELLQHVAGFLDGFSLCQLSRVSRMMRDVCASLLQARGMVVLLWEKRRYPSGPSSWQIKDKVWRFSTAFGTVNEWKFANITSMADHLKKCKFNMVERREEAVPLPCMCFTRELTKEGRSLRSVLKPVL